MQVVLLAVLQVVEFMEQGIQWAQQEQVAVELDQ
jgi:hypothetical protein